MKELGKEFGITTGGTQYHLKTLKEMGVVEWDKRQARSLRLTEGGLKLAKLLSPTSA